MNAAGYYADFLLKTFDVKSKTSRKCYWVVFLINAALSVLLTSIGVVIPQGMPLEIYIGISSVIATPLFVPFFTVIARRLNDVNLGRRLMLLLLIPGIGLIPLLVLCARPSQYGTEEDFPGYGQGAFFDAARKFLSSALVVFPFIYLAYSVYKLTAAEDTFSLGLSAAMLSANFIICVFTAIEAKTAKFRKFLNAWKAIRLLTALSSAVLTIIMYGGSENFIDAFFTVYLYFYVMIAPVVLIRNIYKLVRRKAV